MSLKDKVRYAVLAAIVLLVLFFIVANRQTIEVNVIVARVQIMQAFVIIGSFLAGAGTVVLWGILKPRLRGSGDPDAWKKG